MYLVLHAVEVDGEDHVRVRHRLHSTVHLHIQGKKRESGTHFAWRKDEGRDTHSGALLT